MKTNCFDFTLPAERVAIRPAEPRESARLLVVENTLADHTIADLPSLLKPGDLLVLNNTRVIPARLRGMRGDVAVEVLLLEPIPESKSNTWRALARPGKRLAAGQTVVFAENFSAEVCEKLPSGEVTLMFNQNGDAFRHALETHGHMPLPPYIERLRPADARDHTDYQPLFAAQEGSVAAPTASLHFTPALMQAIAARGVQHCFITLHVGLGTFQPVKAERTEDHVMHSEWAELSAETASAIHAAKARGGRVIAVGSTALRTLEAAAQHTGNVQPFCGKTDIFITPGYAFRTADVMLTNFHLPRSTLFMLVAAFSGLERMHAAYAHAITQGYRFYSYGDACWLERG